MKTVQWLGLCKWSVGPALSTLWDLSGEDRPELARVSVVSVVSVCVSVWLLGWLLAWVGWLGWLSVCVFRSKKTVHWLEQIASRLFYIFGACVSECACVSVVSVVSVCVSVWLLGWLLAWVGCPHPFRYPAHLNR